MIFGQKFEAIFFSDPIMMYLKSIDYNILV